MKFLISFVLCFVAVNCILDDSEYPESLQQLSKAAHAFCVGETGCAENSIRKLRNDEFENPEQSLKDYNNCLWDFTKATNKDLELNVQVLKDNLPVRIMAEQIQTFTKCLAEVKALGQSDYIENTWLATKCIHDTNPDNFIFF